MYEYKIINTYKFGYNPEKLSTALENLLNTYALDGYRLVFYGNDRVILERERQESPKSNHCQGFEI